jgi:pilus assembly protein CpaC
MRRQGERFRAAWIAALVVGLLGLPAAPAAGEQVETISVDLGASQHLRLGRTITRVSVGSDIATVDAFPPNELLVTGRRLGRTTMTVWNGDQRVMVVPVVVGYPKAAMEDVLRRAIPGIRDLHLDEAGTSLVVSGQVSDVGDAERAEQILRGFLGGGGMEIAPELVNLLRVTGDHQVQLEVSFAEVSRSGLRQIGVNLWQRSPKNYTGGLLAPQTTPSLLGDGAPAGELGPIGADGTPIVLPPIAGTFSAIFGLGNDHAFPFAAALSVLAGRGYARTLAEPTLVAMSGKKASFLAGGEFPLPLPQALGQVTIEFKKFGVQLDFVPTVSGDEIQLAVDVAVSDLDFALGIRLSNVTVPGLTTRHSSTTVRLRDGQSFAIAGLLSDKVRSNVDKIPWLGDLPILGALFRSTRYQREETELLVVVTARLVRPLSDRPLLPGEGEIADPSDLELFFLGTHESKPVRGRPSRPRRPEGPVGFRRSGGGSGRRPGRGARGLRGLRRVR